MSALNPEDKALVDKIIKMFHAQWVIVDGERFTCPGPQKINEIIIDKSSNL